MEKVEISKDEHKSEDGQLSSSISISSQGGNKIDSKRERNKRSYSSSSSEERRYTHKYN